MEAETELDEKNNLNILYDLLIYSEWKQEPELPVSKTIVGRHTLGIIT